MKTREESSLQLAVAMAHELSNVLLGIASLIELDTHSTGDNSARLRALLERSQWLTAQILETSSHSLHPKASAIDLHAWLKSVAEAISSTLPPDVCLTVKSSPDVAHVAIDPLALEHVLRILIDNSARAIGNTGEIVISAHRSSGTSASCQHVELRVEDSGPGVLPEHAEAIFEVGFSTRSERRRTGLGLPLARRILAEWGGTIACSVAPHRGASFVVRLPHVGDDA